MVPSTWLTNRAVGTTPNGPKVKHDLNRNAYSNNLTKTPQDFFVNRLTNGFFRFRGEKHWPGRCCWFGPSLSANVIFLDVSAYSRTDNHKQLSHWKYFVEFIQLHFGTSISHKKYKLSQVDKFQKAQRSSFMKAMLHLRGHVDDPPFFVLKI